MSTVANLSANRRLPVWFVVLKRELSAFYASPVAYIVMGLFLVFSGLLFFSTFFLSNRAELRGFFALLPMLFSFFIPAITMRLFAEEHRSGSIESLLTLPILTRDAVLGKFLSSVVFIAAMLLPTLSYVITAFFLGTPEIGLLIGGYVGSLFLAACFSAIGLFASAVTKNQIVAFFIAFTVCFILSMMHQFAVLLPSVLVSPIEYLSAGYHFELISRGILDSRDVLYFLSVTVIFLVMTVKTIQKRREF